MNQSFNSNTIFFVDGTILHMSRSSDFGGDNGQSDRQTDELITLPLPLRMRVG